MDSEKKFWQWFIQHQQELLDFESNSEELFDRLSAELQKVDPDLTFEFGPKLARRELAISAGGMRRAFPAVISLVESAPALDQWSITAFRPRRAIPNIVEFRGKRINPIDVQFTLLVNGATPGIYLFIPDYREGDVDLKQIGYLLLDDTLGEYDVETQLGGIRMLSPDAPTEGDRYPLMELPALFDQLVNRLEGRSGKPS